MDNATEYRCNLWSPKKAIHEIILNHAYLFILELESSGL